MVRQPESVSFVGLGYVGLCTATVMASRGIRIIGVDVDEKRIEELRKGHPPFHEPQLQPMLRSALRKKRIEFTTDASRVSDSNAVFLTDLGLFRRSRLRRPLHRDCYGIERHPDHRSRC